MQTLRSYNPAKHSAVQRSLEAFEDPVRGLTANTCLTAGGWFARFVWPDWPFELANEFSMKVEDFCRKHELLAIQEGSAEWNAVFHGWRSDPDSAEAIGKAFGRYFGERAQWVESEKDLRGRIAAQCMVQGLLLREGLPMGHPIGEIVEGSAARRAERHGYVSLDLSWKASAAVPPGPMSDSDKDAFLASTQEVFHWAAQRVRPVLDALHARLKNLYGERLRGLYVFGSYARPDAGIELPEDSDLDVALLLSDFENAYDEIKRIGEATYDLSLEHGLVVSVVPVREADYREGLTNFARVISSYAVPVR